MFFFIAIIALFILFFILKINKKRKINNLMLKPLKYNIDTRRSPWTRNRGGF
jgi:hypothetical protein